MATRRNLWLHFSAIACAIGTSSSVFSQTNFPMPITHEVNVQLVQATTLDGSEVATVFGVGTQREQIQSQVNNIWGQCGIRVNFASTIETFASDFAFDGRPADFSTNVRPENDLGSILLQGNFDGVANSNSTTVAAYFTGISPGHALLPTNTAGGLARVDGNGTTLAVGAALTSFPAGRAVIAFVFAHELGHNLGLNHLPSGQPNLLSETAATTEQLTPAQCSTIFTDDFGNDGFELLHPVSFAACDFDGDGQCDLTDLGYIYNGFGTDNALLNLDDSDGLNTVNELDINAWLILASDPSNPFKADPADTYVLGDADFDGNVESDDLGMLLNFFESSVGLGWDRGDFNADNVVDGVDLGLLLNNFNFQSAAVAAVPEPDALGLCSVALIAALMALRKRREPV